MRSLLRRLTAFILALTLLGSFCTVSAWDLPEADSPEFEELFPIPPFMAPPPAYSPEEDVSNTVLAGKSILFLGDSYTMGYGLEDFSQSWCAMLESEYNMDVTCYSIHGSTLGIGRFPYYCKGGCFLPISQRPLPEADYDIVFIACGSNDWYCEIPLRDALDSRNTGTFIGAINTTIDRVQEAYPNALIIFMTPWVTKGVKNFRGETTDDYSRALVQVCQARDVECFEAYLPWVSKIYANKEDFRERYFLTSTDPWHLNAAGQQHFLPTIAEWISQQWLERIAELKSGLSAEQQMDLTV